MRPTAITTLKNRTGEDTFTYSAENAMEKVAHDFVQMEGKLTSNVLERQR